MVAKPARKGTAGGSALTSLLFNPLRSDVADFLPSMRNSFEDDEETHHTTPYHEDETKDHYEVNVCRE
jgi:hypothetical protein